jgi:L-alanine-DL-glutamate epimerase-like enolase superfamily enzyme
VDDVPWKGEVTTAVPEIRAGELAVPRAPGWGAEVDEDVLQAHPWPA